jgi:hypothetical protein
VASGIYEGSGPPTLPAPQGTLYYDNAGVCPSCGIGGHVYEYTGAGMSTTTTLIADGNASTVLFTVHPGAEGIFTISSSQHPASPIDTPYNVFFTTFTDTFWVANNLGVYQFAGIIYAGYL